MHAQFVETLVVGQDEQHIGLNRDRGPTVNSRPNKQNRGERAAQTLVQPWTAEQIHFQVLLVGIPRRSVVVSGLAVFRRIESLAFFRHADANSDGE